MLLKLRWSCIPHYSTTRMNDFATRRITIFHLVEPPHDPFKRLSATKYFLKQLELMICASMAQIPYSASNIKSAPSCSTNGTRGNDLQSYVAEVFIRSQPFSGRELSDESKTI